MIEIKSVSSIGSQDRNVCAYASFNKDAIIAEILYGLIEMLELDGYKTMAIDHLVRAYAIDSDGSYSFKEFLKNRISNQGEFSF